MYTYVFIRATFVSDFLKFGSISGCSKFRVSVKTRIRVSSAQDSLFFLGSRRDRVRNENNKGKKF